ncbi:MAG: PilZ domain-containing protein, partial [Treponema sp.]|nr:PilZ domain-containing protein [Treponema sp.]
KDVCPIIILKGENFPLEETSKAFFLGVSGLVQEDLGNPAEMDRLQKILSRYIPVEEKRKSSRIHVEPWHRIGLLINSPKNKVIITGEVKSISPAGLSFLPSGSSVMKDIALNDEVNECSLRAGEEILSPACRLVRTGRIVSFEFVSFPPGEQKKLEQYLEEIPLMELKRTGNKG